MKRHDLEATGICVVIAAHNAEGTVNRAVGSALAQDHVREVIVVDDASTDQTAAAARAGDDGSGRLKVLVETSNLGPAGARNRALACSQAAYFCVLDADDYMLPGRMARLIASGGAGEWDMIADDIIILPQQGRLTFSLQRGDGTSAERLLDVEGFVLGNISLAGRPRGELGFLKPVVSRAFMRQHALAYDETIRLGEDYAFYLLALLHGATFRLVSACGYVAVERPDSLSARHGSDDLARTAAFDDAVLQGDWAIRADERRALEKHRDATRNKFIYAAALEKKQADGIGAGLAWLAGKPSAWPFVLAETLRAKTQGLARRVGLGSAGERPHLRFLIGLPDAQLADIRTLPAHEERGSPLAEPLRPSA